MKLIQKKWWLWLVAAIIFLAMGIRIFHLDKVPPALYWEEVAIGYDAYSVLHTGKDHHGHSWPIVAFESFGDNKPAFYFYAVMLFEGVFGLSAWAVRLPSALAGVTTIGAIGFLMWKLSEGNAQYLRRLSVLMVTFITAVNPWAIQFSRGGWEVNLATCLVAWGVVCGWQSWVSKNKFKWLLGAMFLLALSMYTYHAARLVAPILAGIVLVGNLLPFPKKIALLHWSALKKVLASGVVFSVLILPLLLVSTSSVTQQRFAETSILADGKYFQESLAYKESLGGSPLTKIFAHRWLFAGRQVLANYLEHFRFDFWFVNGDLNPRHSTQFVGNVYLFELVPLCIGLGFLCFARKYRSRFGGFIVLWILVGILPASLTKAAPHALRILIMMPAIMLSIGVGYLQIALWLEQKGKYFLYLGIGMVLMVYAWSFSSYWRYYTSVYPILVAKEWQYGYPEVIAATQLLKQQYPNVPIFFSGDLGRPAMYYWFYTQTDPKIVQAANATARKDQGEFLNFENISFVNTLPSDKESILVGPAKDLQPLRDTQRLHSVIEIHDARGQTFWLAGVLGATPTVSSATKQ